MNRISNYHSHTYLCGHATGDVEDYVKEAIKGGYQEIGISDHGYVPADFIDEKNYKLFKLDHFMTLNSFKEIYLKNIEYCQKKYPNIKILKGLEVEYVRGHDNYYEYLFNNVDYLNYGVHYFYNRNNKVIDSYLEMTEEDMIDYAKCVDEALAKGWYSCLAHPDLYLYNVNEFKDIHAKVARMIIESCIKYDVYLEVNANGRNNKYPRLEFWQIVKEYKNAKIILGSDAHCVEDYNGEKVKKAIKFCEELKLNVSEKMDLKEHK